jgi:hypothetical protein
MKTLAILLALFCSPFIAGQVSLAEEPQEPQGEFESFDQARPRSQGEGMGMMKMKGKGMMHQQPTVVATSDGGVVVLQGPKLAKYDAQLNLVGEVELKGGPKPKEAASHDHGSSAPVSPDVIDAMDEAEVAAMLGEAPKVAEEAQAAQ